MHSHEAQEKNKTLLVPELCEKGYIIDLGQFKNNVTRLIYSPENESISK